MIAGRQHRIFFGSDSGYHPAFEKVGEAYGPFDLTLLECGAYSPYWPDVHNTPEEAARAHVELGGKVMMPIHWAKFNLAQHAWTEPVGRLQAAARERKLSLLTPRIGQIVVLGQDWPNDAWWEGMKE